MADPLKHWIAEHVAKQLIREGGIHNTDTTIALRIADVRDDIDQLDNDDLLKLIKAYLKVADVHVSIPTYKVQDDGTILTERELKAQFEASMEGEF